MSTVMYLALMGGLFAVLVFIHFLIDWGTQNHKEAMTKHNHFWVRTKHCLIYAFGFFPFFYTTSFTFREWIAGFLILFVSHHFQDTYVSCYLWAKYVRRPPQMTEPRKSVGVDGYVSVLPADPKAGFLEFIDTTLGKILLIAIDQIIHLAFLFPIAWIAMRHL